MPEVFQGYVILFNKGNNIWEQFTAIAATSPREAVDKALSGDLNTYPSGTYMAIPSIHWRQINKTVEPSLKELVRDLIEAVKANDPELVGNDLGNAIDALEDRLK